MYGAARDKPLAASWDSDGTDTIGLMFNSTFYLGNSNSGGVADLVVWFGNPSMLPPTPTPSPTPVVPPALNASFTYDGDGKRVKSTINGTTTYFVGAHYEVANGVVTKYYFAGAQRIAMRTNGTLNYLIGDHLGSTSLTTDANGYLVSEMRYKAWGEVRYASGNLPTKYQYTGQFSYESDFGLDFYGARWYDSTLGRFNQPDTIIPNATYSQAWDRYAYTFNNPLLYTDPTGHDPIPDFFGGLLKEFARTNFWWHPGYQRDLAIKNNESTAELTGRLVADVASFTLGVGEAGGGAGVAGGGVVACGTGVGCLVTPGGLAAGGALIAQGAGTTLSAANGAGTIWVMLSNQSDSDSKWIYEPSPKHNQNSQGDASPMDLDKSTAQEVLNQGVPFGKQVYSYHDGKVYVFQPDNAGTYHGYISTDRVPTPVLRNWKTNGLITNSEYNDMLHWGK